MVPTDKHLQLEATIAPASGGCAIPDSGRQSPTFSDIAFSDLDRDNEVADSSDRPYDGPIIDEYYEGPAKCLCCVNWLKECPADLKLTQVIALPEDEHSPPLLVRYRQTFVSIKPFEVSSVEVCNKAAREILVGVFEGLDSLFPDLAHLAFLAPFHPFFFRWERFEKAVNEQNQDSLVGKALRELRRIVKEHLGSTFTVSKDLIDHGVITHRYLWTVFQPGTVVYSKDCFYVVSRASYTGWGFTIFCKFVEREGKRYGFSETSLEIRNFDGSSAIKDLNIVPISHLEDYDTIKEKLLERGKRYCSLVDGTCLSYHENLVGRPGSTPNAGRRVVIDHSHDHRKDLAPLEDENNLSGYTSQMQQQPIQLETAPTQHVPLPENSNGTPAYRNHPAPPPMYHIPPTSTIGKNRKRSKKVIRRHSPPVPPPPPPPRPSSIFASSTPGFHSPLSPLPMMPSSEVIYDFSNRSWPTSPVNGKLPTLRATSLTDFQLLLLNDTVEAFDLRSQEWDFFELDNLSEIEWNPEPFESLVLPDGYKDLIYAFVENQIKDGERFDDVINGKGGGLVVLLHGGTGIGKTLTAESVAEKVKAPLYKMQINDIKGDDEEPDVTDIEKTFEQAARWKAVLLLDECDAYLEKRRPDTPKRNQIVTQFLRKLEYYPSLLFLTTNRAESLDPAVLSRVHLTINYPELDVDSRFAIWCNCLARGGDVEAGISPEDLDRLAAMDLNGRRIKNVVKTAQVMARRDKRAVNMQDVKNILRITEGLDVAD